MSDSENRKAWKTACNQSQAANPPIFWIEWPCDWISCWLGQWVFLDILGRAGRLAILVALISYIMGAEKAYLPGIKNMHTSTTLTSPKYSSGPRTSPEQTSGKRTLAE
jgi:hypothetical protein